MRVYKWWNNHFFNIDLWFSREGSLENAIQHYIFLGLYSSIIIKLYQSYSIIRIMVCIVMIAAKFIQEYYAILVYYLIISWYIDTCYYVSISLLYYYYVTIKNIFLVFYIVRMQKLKLNHFLSGYPRRANKFWTCSL